MRIRAICRYSYIRRFTLKKLLLCLILCAGLIPSVFAKSSWDDDDDFGADKTFGITPGIRISLLGLEPTLALDISHLEIEAACAFNTGYDGNQFAFAPSCSVAYITNPFEKGGSTAFGLEYMYLTPSYTAMMEKLVDADSSGVYPGVHGLSLFYKGCYNFNSVVGLLWRLRLPVLITGTAEGETFNLNITNLPGFAGCFLLGVCTTAIGVKFTF